jgi:hypothetical protein
MRIINESAYPSDIIKHVAVWSLSDLTPEELDVLADATITVTKMPTDWDAHREEGVALYDRTAFVYLREGYNGHYYADFVESIIDILRHEVEHLLQFERYRSVFATDPAAADSSLATGLVNAAMSAFEPSEEDRARDALIERVVDEVMEKYAAEDEAEATAAGDRRLEDWRSMSSAERDSVKFNKLVPSGTWLG